MLHAKRIGFMIMMTSLFLFFSINTLHALRCGDHLVSIGDRSFKIFKKCGEPVSKEQIGYTITKDEKRELKIDEWVYGPKNGHYYHLIFEGNKLVEIKAIRK